MHHSRPRRQAHPPGAEIRQPNKQCVQLTRKGLRRLWMAIVCYSFPVALLVCPPASPAVTSDPTGSNRTTMNPPMSPKDFTFGYYPNGWRKNSNNASPDILSIETGYYGFTLDVDNLSKPRFGLITDDGNYMKALAGGIGRLDTLSPADLSIEVKQDGRVYRAVTCSAGRREDVNRMADARLWESARFVQHYDFSGLEFVDEAGNQLNGEATLDVLAWPDSLTLTLHVMPAKNHIWTNAEVSIGLKSGPHDWRGQQTVQGEWKEGETKDVCVTCDVLNARLPQKDISIRLLNQDGPVVFDPMSNCHTFRTNQRSIKRTWDANQSPDLREYDEFLIEVENKGLQSGQVPFLLNFTNPPGITGVCPILCDPNGVPTGIPVQLSKNWHHHILGGYLRGYTLLPAPTGKSTYLLRVTYGFYGTIPQATHAQLSLASNEPWGNKGGNARWDQTAVGAWGETLCLDMDYSLSGNIITDNRGLLIRNSKDGPKWCWVEGGWGGNWLETKDTDGKSRLFTGVKTAYLSHGPCLSDVRYEGHYGQESAVTLKSTVRVPRGDDYVRTFFDQSYIFHAAIPTKGAWLFNMGGGHRLATPQVAYGNRDGLIAEHTAPTEAKSGDLIVDHLELTGKGPWWIAYPDADVQLPPGRENFGKASRALVIRSYDAKFGGKTVSKPSLSLSVHNVQGPGKMDIDCLIVPPKDVAEFQPGDRVKMDLEWITVPRNAEEYYGPNEALRQHLTESPRSWKTIHREAAGNNLALKATGGKVTHRYPIIVQAEKPTITVNIQGGVGFVPIRFDGLPSARGYRLYEVVDNKPVPLDQSTHGNDFWQTDYDPASKTYSLTYNLPLDGKTTSRWILKADKQN